MDTLFCTGIYKDGYGVIARKVMRDKSISCDAKAVYAYICSFAGTGGNAFPSLEMMCSELGIGEKKLYKCRKELVEKNLIIITKKRIRSKYSNNIYCIVNDPKPIKNIELKEENEPSQNEHVQNEHVQNEHVQNEPCPFEGTNNNSINNNNNKKENKKKKDKAADNKTEFDELINNYTTNDNLKETLYEFIKFRKTIKATLTTLALKKILNKLSQLAKTDKEKIEVLETSIMNGWKGIFPLKQKGGVNYARNNRVFSPRQDSNSNSFRIKEPEWGGLSEEEYKRAAEEGLI